MATALDIVVTVLLVLVLLVAVGSIVIVGLNAIGRLVGRRGGFDADADE